MKLTNWLKLRIPTKKIEIFFIVFFSTTCLQYLIQNVSYRSNIMFICSRWCFFFRKPFYGHTLPNLFPKPCTYSCICSKDSVLNLFRSLAILLYLFENVWLTIIVYIVFNISNEVTSSSAVLPKSLYNSKLNHRHLCSQKL